MKMIDKRVQFLFLFFISFSVLFVTWTQKVTAQTGENDANELIPEPTWKISSNFTETTQEFWGSKNCTGHGYYNLLVNHGNNGEYRCSTDASNITEVTSTSSHSYIRYSQDNYFRYANRIYDLQFQLMSLSIICSGEKIVFELIDCSDFKIEQLYYSYSDSTAELIAQVFYNNIRLDTYNQGISTINFSITQRYFFNSTDVILKVQPYFDFRNCSLFSPTSFTEYSVGSLFSLELGYNLLLSHSDVQSNNWSEVVIPYSTIENNQLYYEIGDNASIYRASLLQMGDTFQENNGFETIDRPMISNITVYDAGDSKARNVYPCETFANLTYKTTKWILSDPIINSHHEKIQKSSNLTFGIDGSPFELILCIAGIMGINLYRKIKRNGSYHEI